MTEIEPSGCECFRVFAAIETFSALDVSRRCRDRSGAANWRQSENEVKHYTCFIRPWYGLSEYTHFVGLSPTSSWWKSHFKSKKSTSTYVSTKFDLTVLQDDWMDFRLEYVKMWQIWPKAYDRNSGWWMWAMPRVCRDWMVATRPRHVRDT